MGVSRRIVLALGLTVGAVGVVAFLDVRAERQRAARVGTPWTPPTFARAYFTDTLPACTGRRSAVGFDRIQWRVVDEIAVPAFLADADYGVYVGAYYFATNTLYVTRATTANPTANPITIRHELTHGFARRSGHTPRYFRAACRNILPSIP